MTYFGGSFTDRRQQAQEVGGASRIKRNGRIPDISDLVLTMRELFQDTIVRREGGASFGVEWWGIGLKYVLSPTDFEHAPISVYNILNAAHVPPNLAGEMGPRFRRVFLNERA